MLGTLCNSDEKKLKRALAFKAGKHELACWANLKEMS